MINRLREYKPAVNSSFLVFMAGIVWLCVGIMLLSTAFSWLFEIASTNLYFFAGAGVILALLVHHFGFLRIVDKNLVRILPMSEKRCLFSFIPWKSYLIIAIMVAMGMVLRHSTIPKQYLAICYIGIGLALMLSSMRYMRIFLREIKKEKLHL